MAKLKTSDANKRKFNLHKAEENAMSNHEKRVADWKARKKRGLMVGVKPPMEKLDFNLLHMRGL